MREQFQAKMLRIHFIEADKWKNEPLHEAILKRCMDLGLAGAMVYRGIEGFGASARIHHARTLSISKNAPVMVSVIDTDEQIQKLLPYLDQMIGGGIVAISDVEVIRYSNPPITPSGTAST